MCEVRFVECQYCEGSGEALMWAGWSSGADWDTCPVCHGTGRAETRVYPVECDDDLHEKEDA